MDSTLVLTALLAVLAGLALGLLGGGGSILMVPILAYAAGLPTHEAIATSMLVVGAASLVALVPHARARRVRYGTALLIGGASMPGAFAGASVGRLLPPALLLCAFGLMMIVTSIAMMKRASAADASDPRPARSRAQEIARILAQGLAVGALTGFVGAGGGFLIVPALVLFGGVPMRQAVATSLLVIAMNSFAGFAGYASAVTLDGSFVTIVTAAAVLGSLGGAWLTSRVDPRSLRKAFAWFVAGMAVLVLDRELARVFGLSANQLGFWVVLVMLAAVTLAVVAKSASGLAARPATRYP
jgi:hypothetical protein